MACPETAMKVELNLFFNGRGVSWRVIAES
jgi:hypothetical protein